MKPGIKTIIAGGMIFIFGAFIVPVLIILPLVLRKSNDVQFSVPGTAEFNAEKPGRYYLWNDYQTIFEGKSYNRSKGVPDGMEINILSPDGTPLKFVSSSSISETDNASSKNSIGYVEIVKPGKVKIEVSGGNEQRIFSFERSYFAGLFGLIFGGIGLTVLLTLSGIGIAIWGIVKFSRSNQR